MTTKKITRRLIKYISYFALFALCYPIVILMGIILGLISNISRGSFNFMDSVKIIDSTELYFILLFMIVGFTYFIWRRFRSRYPLELYFVVLLFLFPIPTSYGQCISLSKPQKIETNIRPFGIGLYKLFFRQVCSDGIGAGRRYQGQPSTSFGFSLFKDLKHPKKAMHFAFVVGATLLVILTGKRAFIIHSKNSWQS